MAGDGVQVDDQGDLLAVCGIGHGLVVGIGPLGARGTAPGPKGGCSGMAVRAIMSSAVSRSSVLGAGERVRDGEP